jgi:thiamine kinase-like enzyme
MDLRVPHCHVADGDPSGLPFIIVLEAVADARQLDQLDGISLADAEAVIDEIVKLHTRWWDHPELDELSWLPPMNNPMYKGYGQVLPDLAVLLRQQWGDRLDPAGFDILDVLSDKYEELLDWLVASAPQTFCHYDLRPDNILVEPSGLCVLDWQLTVRNRGAFDIAYFLGQNVATDFRRIHEAGLVARYHRGLEAAGVTGYAAHRCWDDYRSSMLMHLISATQIQTLDGGNERGTRLLDAMLTQGWQSAVDLNAGEFLDQF